MRLANRLGMSWAFANSAKKPIVRSGAIGLLVTSDPSDPGYLEAGRMFQRVWLKATQTGLSFQPLGALPLFLTKLAVEGPDVFQTSHAAALESIVTPFHDLFSNKDRSAPVMLFRIGYAPAPPTARSIRYPLDQILIHESESDAN
jgi:hypothetical protein